MFDIDLKQLFNAEAQAFYEVNRHEPISKLLIKYAKDPTNKARSIQLEARKRAQKKLPTWYNHPEVVFPPKANLEQASSERTAAYKAQLFSYQSSIDLTGGTGIDSWQWALHGKKHTYVEPNKALCALAKHNFNALGLPQVNVECKTAEDFLESLSAPVDLIYLDPSRRAAGNKKVTLQAYQPDVIALLPVLLKHAKTVVVKVSPLADLTYLVQAVQNHCAAIYVLAVKNECKETLLQLTAQSTDQPEIQTVNLTDNHAQVFRFKRTDENQKATLAARVCTYLYEPNAAILNAGAFNAVACKYSLQKLDLNSHLYTSDVELNTFPGHVYRVVEVAHPYKLRKVYQGMSITSRNFPDAAEHIKKRLKSTEGNNFRLFATTVAGKRLFIVAELIY